MKKSFADRIEELRGDKTQKEFANLLGIPLNTYTNWTRGLRFPTAEAVVTICTQLGCSANWLLGLSEDVQPEPPKRALSNVSASAKGDTYWRDLAISQQATIAQLVAQLAEGRASVAAPAKTGGRVAIKTAG